MPNKRGWFKVPGVQDGDRSLAEQMQGLAPALAAMRGKTVLDLGCAEGLIALEALRAGAALVHGVEYNRQLLEVGQGVLSTCPDAILMYGDLNEGLPAQCRAHYDVILALAIIHKLERPAESLARYAAMADRVVIRLPLGSKGVFRAKYSIRRCDTNAVMPAAGFVLEQTLPGPRKELVQHWRRSSAGATR